MDCSQTTAAQMDQEVQSILAQVLADAKKLLSDHRSLLDEVALYLLTKETIHRRRADALCKRQPNRPARHRLPGSGGGLIFPIEQLLQAPTGIACSSFLVQEKGIAACCFFTNMHIFPRPGTQYPRGESDAAADAKTGAYVFRCHDR